MPGRSPKRWRQHTRTGLCIGTRLFEFPTATYNLDLNFADYDVARDGRFLAIRIDDVSTEIHVVLNWTEELRRALGR